MPTFCHKVANAAIALVALLLTCPSPPAQIPPQFTRVYGKADAELLTPSPSSKTSSDVAALQTILNFVSMTGVRGWMGLSATGRVSLPNDPIPHPAKLYLRGSNQLRLDIEKDGRVESWIHDGAVTRFVSNENVTTQLTAEASDAGLLAFMRLFSRDYDLSRKLITKAPQATIAGTQLQRVSIETLPSKGNSAPVLDLYFAPTTGQLLYSTAFVQRSSADSARHLLSTSYSDYRSQGSVLFPHRLTQRVDGDLVWDIELTDVDLTAVPASTLFHN